MQPCCKRMWENFEEEKKPNWSKDDWFLLTILCQEVFRRSRQFAASPSRRFLPRRSLLCRPLCRCVITGNHSAYCSLSAVGNLKKKKKGCDWPMWSWLVSGSEKRAALGWKCSVGLESLFFFFFYLVTLDKAVQRDSERPPTEGPARLQCSCDGAAWSVCWSPRLRNALL